MTAKILLPLLFLILSISCQKEEEWPYPALCWGFAIDGFPVTPQKMVRMQTETGIHPQLIVFYLQWSKNPANALQAAITTSLDTIWNEGAVPCLTWEPMTQSDQTEKMIPYGAILSGQYDAYILSLAATVKAWKKPMMIRLAQEMNIERYPWGTNKEEFGPHSAEIYIKLFRYVVDLFKTQHVENVFWVFCPNVDSIPNTEWNAARNYYPGDQYIDILGMDGYNWNIDAKLAASRHQTWTVPWRSFKEIFQPLYRELKAINPSKPIIVFETAAVEREGASQKILWIQEAMQTAQAWGLKGIVWFQVNKEEDWRINQNDDHAYLPFIPPAKPSLQSWLLQRTYIKNNLSKGDRKG